MRSDDEVRRQLDAVVGDRFDPPRKLGPVLLKWGAAALLAVAAAAVIVTILHTHLRQAQTAPAPPRPVPIQILPGR